MREPPPEAGRATQEHAGERAGENGETSEARHGFVYGRRRSLPSPASIRDPNMSTGFVGILSFELHFPESHSLKEKRMHLRSVKQQLANRTGLLDRRGRPSRRVAARAA